MNERPPARFYAIAVTALALLMVSFVLTINESDSPLATVLGVVGALGIFVCAWMVKRHQRERI